MDSSDFINYKAELVAIRVWTQYQIAKIFGSCKYYTQVLNSETSSDIINYEFADTAFLGALIRDLTFADTIVFTPNNEEVLWQAARISDYYVDALMGELYMDKGEYEKAVEKFDDVISNRSIRGRFKMTSKFDPGFLWYIQLFEDDLSIGEMKNNAAFMISYDNRYNQSNQLWNWTLSPNYQIAPADWFVDQFENHAKLNSEEPDYRFLSLIDIFATFGRDNVISKYTDTDRPFVLTRTARMSLLKAWCSNLIGEEKDAIKELKNVRKRVQFEEIDDDAMPNDPDEALIWLEDVIIEELAYENAFEGQRWFDLMRVASRRDDPSYLADKVAQKYPDESRERIRAKLTDKTNWYIPVFE
jgi:hypothetical protein